MKLYIARHAHASPAGVDDERPLSNDGHRQIGALCRGLADRDIIRPEVIWHSEFNRAYETAQALKEGLGLEPTLTPKAGFTPYSDPSIAAFQLNELYQNALIVSHEPFVSTLASLLLSGKAGEERILFATGAILCLSRLKVGHQTTPWQLEWHITPSLFK